MKRRFFLIGCSTFSCWSQKPADEVLYWAGVSAPWPTLSPKQARDRTSDYGRYRKVLSSLTGLARAKPLPLTPETEKTLRQLIHQAAKSTSFGSLLVAELCSSIIAWSALVAMKESFARGEALKWERLPPVFTQASITALIADGYSQSIANSLAGLVEGPFISGTLNLIDRAGADRIAALQERMAVVPLLDKANVPGLLARAQRTLHMTQVLIPASADYQKRGGTAALLDTDPNDDFYRLTEPVQKAFGSPIAGYGFTRGEIKMTLVTHKTLNGSNLDAAGGWLE